MASIFGSLMFTDKNMTKMTTTVRADNFSTDAIFVGNFIDCTGYFLIKTGPTATTMKFGVADIQRQITLTTNVSAFGPKLIVFSGKRRFGVLIDNDSGFLWG